MAALDDWAVALILLGICALVIVAIILACRLFASWRFTAFFGGFSGEEKAQLTKAEHRNGYMVPASTNIPAGQDEVLMSQGTGGPYYQQYDTMVSEPQVKGQVQGQGQGQVNHGLDMEEAWESSSSSTLQPQQPQQPVEQPAPEVKDTSPVSVDAVSVVSDYEPPGGLQRATSCESVASDSSVMELEPEAPKIGQLEFGLEYDREVSELIVSVIQARDLETDKVTNTVDSYVRLWLYPDKDSKVQTKVHKDSSHPVFKERFLFTVEPQRLDTKTVQFQVCSCDKYARHKLLGETELRLSDIDLRQPIRVWMNLRDLDEKPAEFGDMMFSLSYLPTAERLTVVVVKARHLKWAYGKESGNCFVKVYLLQNGKKVGKKKTSIKKDERNPIFNEAMIFSVPASALPNVQLRLSVIEQILPEGKLTSIGHVIVGSQLSGTQVTHWNQMMSSLRKPVAMWHSLRK